MNGGAGWLTAILGLIVLFFAGQHMYEAGEASGVDEGRRLEREHVPVERRNGSLYVDTSDIVDPVVVNNGRQQVEFARKESPGAHWYQQGRDPAWIPNDAPFKEHDFRHEGERQFVPERRTPPEPVVQEETPCNDAAAQPCGGGHWKREYQPVIIQDE